MGRRFWGTMGGIGPFEGEKLSLSTKKAPFAKFLLNLWQKESKIEVVIAIGRERVQAAMKKCFAILMGEIQGSCAPIFSRVQG